MAEFVWLQCEPFRCLLKFSLTGWAMRAGQFCTEVEDIGAALANAEALGHSHLRCDPQSQADQGTLKVRASFCAGSKG